MARKRKRKTSKGALIKGYVQMVPGHNFELLAEHSNKVLQKKAGIYALYKDDKLYYVGLSGHLKGHFSRHESDRLRGKWNHFSVYMVERTRYMKDMETLLLHLTQTAGNKEKGTLPVTNSLARVLRAQARRMKNDAHQLEKALKRA